MDILEVEREMHFVLDNCNDYLKKLTLLRHNLSADFLSKTTVVLGKKKTCLAKIAVLSLVERGKVSITLNKKGDLKQVLVFLKKCLEGFSLWLKDPFTIICQQPDLTSSYKREVLRLTKVYVEDSKLRIRGIRRSWKKKLNNFSKSKDLIKKNDIELQKLTTSFIDKISLSYHETERLFS